MSDWSTVAKPRIEEASNARPSLHSIDSKVFCVDGEVLFDTWKIGEADIDEFDLLRSDVIH